jgi:hypothetical protein
MIPYRKALEEIKQIDHEEIIMGNGSTEKVTKVTDVTIKFKNKGKMIQVRVENITMQKNAPFNLFSVTQALKKD